MRLSLPVVVLVGLAACASACGQKGPLVLPDAQRPHRKIGLGKPPAPPSASAPTPTGAPPPAPADATSTPGDPPPSTAQPR